MVLVDTSIWVSHFRDGDPQLEALLMAGRVVCHPFIIGELACGQLKKRKEILTLLQTLPKASTVDHKEALQFIEHHQLMEFGLGYVDVHLLASAKLSGVPLWTKDKKLAEVSKELSVLYK